MTQEKTQFYLETVKHQVQVQKQLKTFENKIKQRALYHDESKTKEPELSLFTKHAKEWRDCEFGSQEYYDALERNKHVCELHHKNNRHHPEHFDNGIDGMSLIDIIEMFCDWLAVSKDMQKSLEINEKRFNISPQLMSIIRNTLNDLKKST